MVKQTATCVLVLDGDTFDTNIKVRIRLARVNTPPVTSPEGLKAKVILESLILRKAITYESGAIDVYGRTLAEVWVNSTNVNDVMRSYGWKA